MPKPNMKFIAYSACTYIEIHVSTHGHVNMYLNMSMYVCVCACAGAGLASLTHMDDEYA